VQLEATYTPWQDIVTWTRVLALVANDMPASMSTTGPAPVVCQYHRTDAGLTTRALAVSATTPDAAIKVYHDF
jgi:hypothetical protein